MRFRLRSKKSDSLSLGDRRNVPQGACTSSCSFGCDSTNSAKPGSTQCDVTSEWRELRERGCLTMRTSSGMPVIREFHYFKKHELQIASPVIAENSKKKEINAKGVVFLCSHNDALFGSFFLLVPPLFFVINIPP